MSQRAGQRPFVVASLFRRFDLSECVTSIEHGISEHEVQRAVKIRCAFFGRDLKPGASRTREERRVRILVNSYFLDRRCADPGPVRFYSVDDESHSIGSDRTVIEKPRKCSYVVLVEDGHTVEGLTVDTVSVLILGNIGPYLA